MTTTQTQPAGASDAAIAKWRASYSVDRISNGEIIDKIAGPNYGERLLRSFAAALATQPAPVVGGDAYAEQHARDSKELRKLCESRDFYKRRCEALQTVQSNMRDPERKAVCDILANGSTELLATRPAESVAQGGEWREKLQRQCAEWGAYWRAPDAHGVELTEDQAIELLAEVLGVEVEIKRPCGTWPDGRECTKAHGHKGHCE